VSRGEHIWTAKEVAAAGGHQQVELMRKQAVKGFAVGGPVGPVNLSKLPKVASNHFRDVNAAATDYVGNYAKSVVDKVRSAFEDIFQAAASGKGGWAFPLPRGSFSIGRGPVGHGYPAYDFPAPIGTPIYASRAGVVSRAMRLTTSYGIHAFINHLGGWQSRYAHMSQMFVRAGQFVKQLAMIGRVGSTGNSTGPHLHYENLLNGIRKSPRGVLFDHGNWIVPGWNAMYNATGQSEFLTPTVGGKGGPEKYIHQEITVHTQEIDPRRHAAEMGWELAVRV
jgi:murein DD-endopeptidase MepM/ murein hydrolase activator NlpD